MKKTLDIKKLVLLNMPYILMGLFATNFGEAWRMAQGADASEKFLSLVAVLPGALQSFWPSLHPLDLLVRACGTAWSFTRKPGTPSLPERLTRRSPQNYPERNRSGLSGNTVPLNLFPEECASITPFTTPTAAIPIVISC